DFLLNENKETIKESTGVDSDSLLYNLLRVVRLMLGVETLSESRTEDALFMDDLNHLKGLPTAELERLLGETLDLFTNRLDAVITSIATKRLYHMREIAPEGVYIGAYGWVENLQRRNQEQMNEGGYIIAPTHDQATAAAVLRNAFLTHTVEENKPKLAIRLTSDRVRRAKMLIDGIRQGQPLSALLGYRFEKSLFENYPEFITSFGSCVYEFRKLYPLEVLQEEHDKGVDTETKEVVIPRNVVDGLKLIKAWQRTKKNELDPIPFNSNDVLSSLTAEEKNTIEIELDCIEDAHDAVNDIALYENIYHNVRGNFERAPALLDSLAGSGGLFPEPESILTPRKGFIFKHRIAIIISVNDQQLDNPWPMVNSPRTLAAPHLSNWIGTLLGDPVNILCRYEHEGNSSFISLADLATNQDFGPLDFLSMSTVDIGGGATELEQRILEEIFHNRNIPYATKIRLDFIPNDNWDPQTRSLLEIIPLARNLQKLISDSRILKPSDLLHSESADGDISAIYTKPELDSQFDHVSSIKTKLDDAISSLQQDPITVDQLQDSLNIASRFGVHGSIPLTDSKIQLQVQALDVLNELLKRQTEAGELFTQAENLKNEYYLEDEEEDGTNENKNPAKVGQSMIKLAECLNAIFSTTFKTLPSFTIRNKDELKKSFNIRSGLDTFICDNCQIEKTCERPYKRADQVLNNPDVDPKSLCDGFLSELDRTAIKWLQKAAYTHQKLKEYEDVMILSESFTGTDRLVLEVGQLPHPENNYWFGLPLGGINLEDMQQGSLSLVVSSLMGIPLNEILSSDNNEIKITGLIIDEWDETIPSTTVNAAIAYNYNRPNTEAPQCILLAIPPLFNPNYIYRKYLMMAATRPPSTSSSSTTDVDASSSSSEEIKTYGWWYVEYLAKIVEETIDLAKIRAVDIDAMRVPDDIDDLLDAIDNTRYGGPFRIPGWLRTVNFDETHGFGHFLPALYVPTSIEEEEEDV
ncbi:MAG: hypothetical protein ACFE8B_10850, partial [Candidatus Hermodarchaeota archaeon]